VPLLIIQGTADRVLPFLATGKRLHSAIAQSQLVELKGAPHGIPWTHAVEINRALLDFLSKDQPAPMGGKRAPVNLPSGVEAMGTPNTPETRPTP
jgi:hypothetical protein